MSRVWIVNASPLILLGKIDRVALLSELSDELIVPDVVAREIGAKPEGEQIVSKVASLAGVRFESEIARRQRLQRGIWDEESLRFSPSRELLQAAVSSLTIWKGAAALNLLDYP